VVAAGPPVSDVILPWLKLYDLAGTWADVAGLVGFGVTIVVALKARSAAMAAKEAAEKTRGTIRLFDTVVDFQAVISALEDIKRLHRQNEWKSLPEKYAATRRQLISLREAGVSLDSNQLKVIQSTITNLSDMERQVEMSLAGKAPPRRSEKLNPLISDDNDALIGILQVLKKRGGGPNVV
jgi:hypothetical protein